MSDWSGKALQNFVDIWISPEIQRRQDAGSLPIPFQMTMAQIIFFPSGKPAEVRLNSEVKFRVITNDGRQASVDFDTKDNNFLRFELTEESLEDCGHVTIVGLGDNTWTWSFDLIYNKSKTRQHLDAAREFIGGAEYAAKNKCWRLYAECIFGAKELISRAYLLSSPDQKYERKGSHRATHTRINIESNLGNVPREYIDIFNKFGNLRREARYVEGDVTFSEGEAGNYIDLAKGFLALVEARNLSVDVNKSVPPTVDVSTD